MHFADLLKIVGLILVSLGGGALVIAALSSWLGKVLAGLILQNYKAQQDTIFDALARRRDLYSKLATSLRVHIKSHEKSYMDRREEFLAAYDEAAVWAPDEVMRPLGDLIDLLVRHTARPGTILMDDFESKVY